jgi:hypothetical protein
MMGVSFGGRRMIGNSAMFCIFIFSETKEEREGERQEDHEQGRKPNLMSVYLCSSSLLSFSRSLIIYQERERGRRK